MRSFTLILATGMISMLCGSGSGVAENPHTPPRQLVYLQRSQDFAVAFSKNREDCYEGPMLRELQRQAFSIAARDQLGLITRDAWLGDRMPVAGDNEPFEIDIFRIEPAVFQVAVGENKRLLMKGYLNAPPTLELRRGFYPAHKTLMRYVPKIETLHTKAILGKEYSDFLDHRHWLVEAERLSRTKFVEALRKAGYQGTPHTLDKEGKAPGEIEDSLDEMTFISQYSGVRCLHALLRSEGESPARLGALVRGYANLGLLTEYFWHPAHKVFKARALLYAQRMLATEGRTPETLWHRAYAFSLAGLHNYALEDLEAAEAAWRNIKKEDRPLRPAWVDLIDAHCRFDLKRLEAGTDDIRYWQLARLLWFLSTNLCGEDEPTLAVAAKCLPDMPECCRLHDGMCSIKDWGSSNRTTEKWLEVTGPMLYERLKALKGLPRPAAKVLGAIDTDPFPKDIDEDFQTRADIVRALADTGEALPAGAEGNAGHGAQYSEEGEPSWAALGLLVRELSFAQIWRRAFCLGQISSSPGVDGFLTTSAPLLAGHPYAHYVESLAHNYDAQQAAWAKLRIKRPDGLEIQEYPMTEYYYEKLRHDGDMLGRLLSTYPDLTVRDIYRHLKIFDAVGNRYNPDTYRRPVFRLLVISPYSPYARALAVDYFGELFRDKLPEWEKTADGNARLCRGLATRYMLDKRWESSHKWAGKSFQLSPTEDNALLRGEVYWREGKKERWVAALEDFLNHPDRGLSHGRIHFAIARD